MLTAREGRQRRERASRPPQLIELPSSSQRRWRRCKAVPCRLSKLTDATEGDFQAAGPSLGAPWRRAGWRNSNKHERGEKKKVAKNWQPAEATVTAPGYKVSVAVEMAAESRERGEARSRRSSRAKDEDDVEDDDDDGGRDGQQKSNTRKAKRRGQNGAWRHFFRGGVTWRSRSDEKGKRKRKR